MAKKEEQLSMEYLENKLNTLFEQKAKVEEFLEKYIELDTRIVGAIDVTREMLEDLRSRIKIEPKVSENEKV
jgi:arginine deiminase